MKLLVVSHACVTATNQEFFAEVERQTGWSLTLVAPSTWAGEYGERHLERWPGFSGTLIPIPVWGSGNVPLHVYRSTFSRLLQDEDPDAIYMHHEPYAAATAQVYWANRRTVQAPIGFFTWQNLHKRYPFPFRYTEQMVYRQSTFAISGSESATAILRAKGYDGRLAVIPAGIDPSNATHGPVDPGVRHALGAAENDVLFGYLGRLVPEKGLLTLLDALDRMDSPNVKLALIGEGPHSRALDAAVERLGMQGRVLRHPYVPHTEAPQYLRAFDALVLPSESQPNWKEQFGRVIIEALACGTPVVGSDSGEIPHLIHRTGGGWVFPEGNVNALSETMNIVARHPADRRKRGTAGQAVVHSTYTHAALASPFADTIAESVSTTRSPALAK